VAMFDLSVSLLSCSPSMNRNLTNELKMFGSVSPRTQTKMRTFANVIRLPDFEKKAISRSIEDGFPSTHHGWTTVRKLV
jgi:hypothetical protein